MKKLEIFCLFLILLSTVAQGQEKTKPPKKEISPKELIERQKKVLRAPTGGSSSFYIAPIDTAGLFSVLLTDASGQSLAGTFSLQQIEVFEAVLEASKVFALSNEKVGSGTPITTRLMAARCSSPKNSRFGRVTDSRGLSEKPSSRLVG